MRLFIAINLSAEIKRRIAADITSFKKNINCDLKWIKAVNMHITFKFLGDIKRKSIEVIIEKIKLVSERTQQQSARSGGIAAFPCLDYPKDFTKSFIAFNCDIISNVF